MGKYQPLFDFGWIEEVEEQPKNARPADSAIFIAYIKQVAPQLIKSDCPIHKTPKGYMTNNSAMSDIGQFEFDSKNQIIIHRHKIATYVGNRYEYGVGETILRVEFTENMMIVH